MNTMPSNRVVFPNQSCREMGASALELVDPYLDFCHVGRCQCNPKRVTSSPNHLTCVEHNSPYCWYIACIHTPASAFSSFLTNLTLSTNACFMYVYTYLHGQKTSPYDNHSLRQCKLNPDQDINQCISPTNHIAYTCTFGEIFQNKPNISLITLK